MTQGLLRGRRVLLVEDEYFQAREAKALLEAAGAEVVGPTAHAGDVPALLANETIDAALIDINLGKGADFDLARTLRNAQVPFLFVTGYDGSAIPPDLLEVPRIEKPADERRVVAQLTQLLSAR